MVQSYQGVCPECGYAFENVAINSSVDKLSKSLEKCLIDDEYEDYDKMASKIRSFPVPTSKADIMELIMLIQTHLSALKGKSAFDGVGDYRNACIAKLQECSLKAKIIFPNDPMIQKLVDETEKAIVSTLLEEKFFDKIWSIISDEEIEALKAENEEDLEWKLFYKIPNYVSLLEETTAELLTEYLSPSADELLDTTDKMKNNLFN